jgi:Xaa-Pro aminopeptidase
MNPIKQRLQRLREWLLQAGYDACVIPQADPHLSEYLEPYDQLRAYFSGFTGSAGTLVVTLHNAGLWTDSRYYLQAEMQLKQTSIVLFKQGEPGVLSCEEWLHQQVGAAGVVAGNAFCFSHLQWEKAAARVNMVHNPGFEQLWQERPALSTKPCLLYKRPGALAVRLLSELRERLDAEQMDACLVTALDDIAWILQVRGDDVPYVPVVRSYLWVDKSHVLWWVDAKKVQDQQLVEHLSILGVTVLPYESIESYLQNISELKVWVDQTVLNERIYQVLQEKCVLVHDMFWITERKACKCIAELEAIQDVMLPDAVAWIRAQKWLCEQLENQCSVTELDFQAYLLQAKQQQSGYWGESFEPIVAYGQHGAIVHYESTPQTNCVIKPEGFLLVDAGSHYQYGTTDVTRTLVCGALTAQQKEVYTLVLKGMIAVAVADFDSQTPSAHIDALAREALKKHGYHYGHGTGHGVGTVLSVHERGARLSPLNLKPLQVGMVLSDEPGCYLPGQFGVRIENMVTVQQQASGKMAFKTLTMIPLDCRAIEVALLNRQEVEWINAYHRLILSKVKSVLTSNEYSWLKSYVYEL